MYRHAALLLVVVLSMTSVSTPLTNIEGHQADNADLTLTIDRSDLEEVMMGQKSLMAQIEDGTAKTSSDKSVIQKIASTRVQVEFGFEIMPGTRSASAEEEELNPYAVDPIDIHHGE